MPKTRFTTIDLRASISELGTRLLGLRVNNVYDINSKTYLIRLQETDKKETLLLESGNRIHSTSYEWPKNSMPSGFSMKLRKHLRGRRLVGIKQLGMDRVIDLQFGSDEAAYHLIIELYDRGNIILTDFEFVILNLLRTRKEGDDVRFAVRETFPFDAAKKPAPLPDIEKLREMLVSAKQGEFLRKLLNPHFVFGPALIDHCLLSQGFPENTKIGQGFDINQDLPTLMAALRQAEDYMEQSAQNQAKGYIIQKREKKPTASEDNPDSELLTYTEYHPYLYKQHEGSPYKEFDSFNQAVDDFYSKMESQKLDVKVLQQEKDALKKLENVKKDHEKRLGSLQKAQELDKKKAELIEINLDLVDQAIRVVRSAIANQIDWSEIDNIIREAQKQGDPVASAIKTLKLESNHITMALRDPYGDYSEDGEDEEEMEVQKGKGKDKKKPKLQPVKVDIDLGLSAYANARKHHDFKKHSKKKEERTIQSSEKAIKSAERKTKQALKDVAIVASINKSRKTYWFEKFFWCISSENYLIIAGRDQQQNELVVKKYLTQGDVYVHADLHGASSVIIKNPTGNPVPPKTLNEAGTMAVCYSVAWDAKVITSAWWVNNNQVSKTAPTGEYLSTGSFMIRGKKNYLPPTQLVMGFGFLFKLDESSIWRHKDERKMRTAEEDELSMADSSTVDVDEEIPIPADSDSDEDEKQSTEMDVIVEDVEEPEVTTTDTVKAEAEGDGTPQELKEGSDGSTSDEEESLFPDTTIQLQHIHGNKYEPQRSRGSSQLSSSSQHSAEGDAAENQPKEVKVFLGDDQPVILGQQKEQKPKLSAKQRRELKKKRQRQLEQNSNADEDENDEVAMETQGMEEATGGDNEAVQRLQGEEETKEKEEEEEEEPREEEEKEETNNSKEKTAPQEAVVLKRGQKHKQKKIKQKYKDQDEEERRLKMELLASAGGPKETKKGKKGKKQRQQQQQLQQQLQRQQHQKQKQLQRPQSGKQKGVGFKGQKSDGKVTNDDSIIIVEGMGELQVKQEESTDLIQPVVLKHTWKGKKQDQDADEQEGSDQEESEEQNQLMKDSISILDSLSGCPHEEDLLLFGLPVCAPYPTMQNYKYKVKLTPGTGRRGKAAKTAINMFQHTKEATSREKDLFKGVKDNDLSRNLPGKVKVSAPNLQKKKHKR